MHMAARSVVVQQIAARLVAHAAVIAAAAAVVRALAVLHALKGQWPPAGGRNGSRIAMCRAHSHAVPHTRTVEHDQHWQRSLRWMRKALQNDEPEIGLCEPRLRFLLAEAMQAMQLAAAMLRSAPQKPMMIIHEDHHSIHRLSCHHLSTATTSGSAKEHNHPIGAVVVVLSSLAKASLGDITMWCEPPT